MKKNSLISTFTTHFSAVKTMISPMPLLIAFFLLPAFSNASEPLTLKDVMENFTQKSPQAKIMLEKKKAFKAEYESLISSNYLFLSGNTAQAQPNLGDSKMEYSVGVQKKWLLPHIKDSRAKSQNFANEAQLLKYEKELLALKNSISFLYHNACLDDQMSQKYQTSYELFKSLVAKKERAYKYGESSKKEFLQFRIELIKMKQQLNGYISEAGISAQKLQEQAFLPMSAQKFSCTDMYGIDTAEKIVSTQSSLIEKSLNKQILSAQELASGYNTNLESINFSLNYQKEIDIERVTFGLSIPLGFTSSYNENKRLEALSKLQAFKYKKVLVTKQRNSKLQQLQSKLSQQYNATQGLNKSLELYKIELLPLIKKSYELGESSLVEYLLNKRDLWRTEKEFLVSQKNYYKTLFDIYTVTEFKEEL